MALNDFLIIFGDFICMFSLYKVDKFGAQLERLVSKR
jgi:hypothetical protein